MNLIVSFDYFPSCRIRFDRRACAIKNKGRNVYTGFGTGTSAWFWSEGDPVTRLDDNNNGHSSPISYRISSPQSGICTGALSGQVPTLALCYLPLLVTCPSLLCLYGSFLPKCTITKALVVSARPSRRYFSPVPTYAKSFQVFASACLSVFSPVCREKTAAFARWEYNIIIIPRIITTCPFSYFHRVRLRIFRGISEPIKFVVVFHECKLSDQKLAEMMISLLEFDLSLHHPSTWLIIFLFYLK